MITLAVSKSLPNFTRWEIDDWDPREKRNEGLVQLILRTGVATNYTLNRQLWIRNGASDVIGYSAVQGGAIGDQLVVSESGLATPTGFDDAYAAYRSGVGKAGRYAALEAFLLSSGIVNASLAAAP
jgi:hypothetical protein